MIQTTVVYTLTTSQDRRDTLQGVQELATTKALAELLLKNFNLKTGESSITIDSLVEN